MRSECDKNEFIRDFSKEILKSSAALFIGSGLSRPAGYAGWKDILKEAAADIGLDVEKEEDLISLAEYYVNNKGRTKIDTTISEFFSKEYAPTKNHSLLASLPITSVWTTNYDRLLERAFEMKNVTYSALTDDDSFKMFIDRNSVIIHKLHGDVQTPHKAVITKKDYEEFVSKHEILLAKLKGEMCAKSFLFLGYSLNDTDINHILTEIRLFYKDAPPKKHYCIMARVKDSETDCAYKQRKQEHRIEDLKSYGIHSVLVDSFDEITEMLEEIRRTISRKNVFISGAYEDIAEADSDKFASEISAWLIENDYKIYTGYGKNVGPNVVSGAFEGCCKTGGRVKKFNESVYLFPFPYNSALPEAERRELYTDLRTNAILNTFITIIINGTKLDKKSGSLINSPGVFEEAEISMKQGSLVIPVAKTGGAAQTIWENMNALDTEYTKSSHFQQLKFGKTYNEVFEAIKAILG